MVGEDLKMLKFLLLASLLLTGIVADEHDEDEHDDDEHDEDEHEHEGDSHDHKGFQLFSGKEELVETWQSWQNGGLASQLNVTGHMTFRAAHKLNKLLDHSHAVSTCRYILFRDVVTHDEAVDRCHKVQHPLLKVSSELADIHTYQENYDIKVLLQLAFGRPHRGTKYARNNWVWIGLEKIKDNSRRIKKKHWGVTHFDPQEWLWHGHGAKEVAPTYWRWLKGQPDQRKKGKEYQNYAVVNKYGFWDDTFGSEKIPFICNYCGRFIVVPTHVTWYKAKSMCESYGLTMAKVNSPSENLEIDAAAKMVFGPEPEKRRWNDTNWIWLGTQEVMFKNGTGSKVWQHHDGSQLEWEPKWGRKAQPDNWTLPKKGEERVIAFSRITTKWDDSYPSRKRPFACMCPFRECIAEEEIQTLGHEQLDITFPGAKKKGRE